MFSVVNVLQICLQQKQVLILISTIVDSRTLSAWIETLIVPCGIERNIL